MPKDHTITIGKVTTRLEWLMSPVGLLIDEVEFEGGPISVNPDEIKKSTGEGRFVATVRAKSIEVFLNKLSPGGLTDISVSVDPSGVHVKGIKRVLLPIPATAHAVLRLDSISALSIELINAEAAGAGLKNLVASQLNQMNPIIESDLFPVPVEFDEVIHLDDCVKIRGSVSLSVG